MSSRFDRYACDSLDERGPDPTGQGLPRVWATALGVDTLMALLLFFWLVERNEIAEFAAKGYFLVFVFLTLMSGLSVAEVRPSRLYRPSGFTAYHLGTELLYLVVLLGAGELFLAVVYGLVGAGFEIARFYVLWQWKKRFRLKIQW